MILFATVSFAGTLFSGYDATIGEFYGSGYSGCQTKYTIEGEGV